MRNPHRAVRVSVLALMALVILLWNARSITAASKTGLTMNIFFQVVDEQNTDVFYNTTGYCSSPYTAPPYFQGDLVNGPTSAYNFVPPWTLTSSLASSQYVDGTYCASGTTNCLHAIFDHNQTVISLDTRNSLGPRKVDLNFSNSCVTCSVPGKIPSFGSSLSTPALVGVFLNTPYTSMSVCSSTGCPEAQPAITRLDFTDPTNSQVMWKIIWSYVRVLRMSANTWYVVADACDGTQIAALYRLQNQRNNKIGTSFQGYYLIPYFLTATQ